MTDNSKKFDFSINKTEEIENLYSICQALYENTKRTSLDDDNFKNIISLNGGYGTGKTWFLTEFNHYVQNDINNKYIVQLNIWRDDYADDPLIPILHEIACHEIFKAVDNKLSFLLSSIKKGSWLIKILCERLGFDLKEHIDDFLEFLETKENIDIDAIEDLGKKSEEFRDLLNKAEKFFKDKETTGSKARKKLKTIDPEFFLKQQVLKIIRKTIYDNIKRKKKPFIILVDELDRCRPDYAVTVLERIKHMFNIPGLIFILAIDRKQLEHSVRHAFGHEWDFDNYYLRFAPIEISLGLIADKIDYRTLYQHTEIYQNLVSHITGHDGVYQNECTKAVNKIFEALFAESNATLRLFKTSLEKIKILGLNEGALFPILFLMTDNPYRESFYKLFILDNRTDQEMIETIQNLVLKIMLSAFMPLIKYAKRLNRSYQVNILQYDYINYVFQIFNLPELDLRTFFEDSHGFQDCRMNSIEDDNLSNGYDIKNAVTLYFERLENNTQMPQEMQKRLKELFLHYQP